jgi:hypothetical protein
MLTEAQLIERKMQRIDEVHRYEPKRTALMVIDMQTSSWTLVSQSTLAWEILPKILNLVDFAEKWHPDCIHRIRRLSQHPLHARRSLRPGAPGGRARSAHRLGLSFQ